MKIIQSLSLEIAYLYLKMAVQLEKLVVSSPTGILCGKEQSPKKTCGFPWLRAFALSNSPKTNIYM